MTPHPRTIEAALPLATAREAMLDLDAHHLPVVREGRLVGILSMDDLKIVQALWDRAGLRREITVEDVMKPTPLTCVGDAHLHEVAREMADKRHSCAVVMDPEHPTRIAGVFTTTDALRALSLLAPQERQN